MQDFFPVFGLFTFLNIKEHFLFNPIKSICPVFKQKGYKLYLQTVFIGEEALKFVFESKYLGFSFSDSDCNDCDMLRQMRSLYAKSNMLLRTSSHSSVDVNLFQIYCTALYCPFLWADYKKNQHLQRFVEHSTILIENVFPRGAVQVQCIQIIKSAASRLC